MKPAAAAWASAVLDVLLPSLCPACRLADGPSICPECLAALPRLGHPCQACGASRRDDSAACPACNGRGLPGISRVLVAYAYAEGIERLVGDAKAGARAAAVKALAELIPPLPEDIGAIDAVVPVPPSPGRRAGPHLASALARRVASRHGLSLRSLLRPTRQAAEQHRLEARRRSENVVGLFACRGPAPARILLVDDLLTSGATARSAASALREAGAMRVHLLVLAKTPRRRP